MDSSSSIVLRVEGFEFRVDGTGEETWITDIELGRAAGLAHPINIRKVIRTAIRNGSLRKGEHFRSFFLGGNNLGGRRGEGYELNEAGSMKVTTQLRTPEADAAVDEMIRVYRLLRGQLKQLREPAPASASMLSPKSPEEWAARQAPNGTLRDNPVWVREFRQRIGYVGFRQGLSWRKVEGWLRKSFRRTSYLNIEVMLLDQARRLLELAGDGEFTIARVVKALPEDRRQMKMWN